MTCRLCRAADHPRMPWKNGRGETLQIAIWPDGAGLDDFGWRVSVAGVTEDGAFSRFAQVDRTLAVLTGDRLDLLVRGQGPQRLTPGSGAFGFPADAPCDARLIGGPVTDLNAMTRRGAFRHWMVRAEAARGPDPDWLIVLATRPAALDLPGRPVALAPMDALICDGAQAALPLPPLPGLWLIGISAA